MKLKNLFLAALVLSLSACAFEKNKGLDDNGEAAYREKLRKSYKTVEGTYQGTLTIGTQVQKIELKLTVLEKTNGTNSNGAPKMVPYLAANFKRLDPVSPSYEFIVRPFEDMNQLVLTNANTDGLTRDDVHTITAVFHGTEIIGEAASTGGYLGKINLQLTSRESSGNNGTTEENEYYNNLRNQYRAIEGVYEGQIVSRYNSADVINVTLNLSILEKDAPQGNGKYTIPYLVGTLHDIADKWNFSDWALTATYNTDTTPYTLTFKGIPAHGSGNNGSTDEKAPRVTLFGTLENNVYTGTFGRSPSPFNGAFVLKRTQAPAKN